MDFLISIKWYSQLWKHHLEATSYRKTLQRLQIFWPDQNENKLKRQLSEGISNYESFGITFTEVLSKHTPLRKKFYRANHAP